MIRKLFFLVFISNTLIVLANENKEDSFYLITNAFDDNSIDKCIDEEFFGVSRFKKKSDRYDLDIMTHIFKNENNEEPLSYDFYDNFFVVRFNNFFSEKSKTFQIININSIDIINKFTTPKHLPFSFSQSLTEKNTLLVSYGLSEVDNKNFSINSLSGKITHLPEKEYYSQAISLPGINHFMEKLANGWMKVDDFFLGHKLNKQLLEISPDNYKRVWLRLNSLDFLYFYVEDKLGDRCVKKILIYEKIRKKWSVIFSKNYIGYDGKSCKNSFIVAQYTKLDEYNYGHSGFWSLFLDDYFIDNIYLGIPSKVLAFDENKIIFSNDCRLYSAKISRKGLHDVKKIAEHNLIRFAEKLYFPKKENLESEIDK